MAIGLVVGNASAGAKKVKRKARPAPVLVPPRQEAGAAAALGRAYEAYRAGDLAAARALVPRPANVANRDYALYIAAQSAALDGDPAAALPLFTALAGMAGSRFHDIAA